MATVEGLQLRGSKYSLLVLIPKDLQASYGGKTRVVRALGTSDKAEAVRKGLRLKAEWLEEFEAKRKRVCRILCKRPINSRRKPACP